MGVAVSAIPGGRLLHGERQVAHRGRHLCGVLVAEPGGPALEVLDGLLAQEDVHGQRVPVLGPALVAGGHQDVAGTALREVATQLLGVVRVVEDQQPAVGGHPAPQQVDGLLGGGRDVVAALGAEPGGEFGERGDDVVGLLGRYPPDQVVVGHEAVHVLQGHLGLADAAESVQGLRLRQDDGQAAAELVAHPLQDERAAGEAWVAGRRVPDPRYGAGEAGSGRDPVGHLHRAVQGPHHGGGGVHLVQPEEVDRVAVDVRGGQAYVPDPQRDQPAAAAADGLGGGPFPQLDRALGLQIRAGEQDDGAGGVLGGGVGRLLRGAFGGDVARNDPEAGPGENRFEPVGPHPVLRHIAEVEIGGQGGPAPGEGVADPQPDLFADRGHRGDLPVGDDRGEPFEGGEQRVGEPGLVAEGGERLLVGVVGPVRDLHRPPVGGEFVAGQIARQPVELEPGQRPSGVRLLLLALVDAHRYGVEGDGAAGVALGDLAGDRGRAVDGLVAEGEAVDEHVREVDGADVGDVAEAGPAVDQYVVVVGLHVVAQGVEEVAAAEPVVEVVPVEGGDGGAVLAVLASGGDEVERAALRELPAERLRGQRHGVRLDAGVVAVPVLGTLGGAGRGPGVLGDQVDHTGGGAEGGRVEEGVEEPVESGGLQVPVDGQDPLAVGREDPGDVGERHGAPGAALVRVEGDDAPVTTGTHRSSASVAGSCGSGM